LIVSDEIHSDLVFKPHKFVPMASISDAIDNFTITCIAPSKTFNMAALSTSSVIISNKELKEKYDKILDTIHVGLGNVFGTVASEAAYTHGYEWLQQLLDYLVGNIDFAENYFKEKIPQIKMIRPEGTYLVWLDCRELNMSDEELNQFFTEKAKLGLNNGTIFGTGGEGFMRMNVACQKSVIEKALQNIEKALK